MHLYAYRHIRSTQESGKTQSKSEKEHLNLPSVSWLPQSFSLTPSTRPPPPFLLTKPLPINAEPSNLLFIPSGGANFTDQLRSNLGGVFLSRGGGRREHGLLRQRRREQRRGQQDDETTIIHLGRARRRQAAGGEEEDGGHGDHGAHELAGGED